jgi:hypothetical protein
MPRTPQVELAIGDVRNQMRPLRCATAKTLRAGDDGRGLLAKWSRADFKRIEVEAARVGSPARFDAILPA